MKENTKKIPHIESNPDENEEVKDPKIEKEKSKSIK